MKDRFPYQAIADYVSQSEQSSARLLAQLYQSIEQLEGSIRALEDRYAQLALAQNGSAVSPSWVYEMNERYRLRLDQKIKNLRQQKEQMKQKAEEQQRQLVRLKMETRKWSHLRRVYIERQRQQLLSDEQKMLDDIAMRKRP